MSRREEDRRRHERTPLAKPGYYVLEDGCYHLCEIEDVSATGILVKGVPSGHFGEWVVIGGSELGRVEGVLVRTTDAGFAIEIARPHARRGSLQEPSPLCEGGSRPVPVTTASKPCSDPKPDSSKSRSAAT